MQENITYAFVIILLPLIPSVILYTLLPNQESHVDGIFKGLNIKLKGAFGSYFILVLLLSGFMTTKLLTEHKYEYWTIDGKIKINNNIDPAKIDFLIKPPNSIPDKDGRFTIEDIPVAKGEYQHSTLTLQFLSTDNKIWNEVIQLQREELPFSSHKLKFKKKGRVTIVEPIELKPLDSENRTNRKALPYNPSTAQTIKEVPNENEIN